MPGPRCTVLRWGGLAVVGDAVEGASFAHALALEEYDHAGGMLAIEANLHLAGAEVVGTRSDDGVVGKQGASSRPKVMTYFKRFRQ